jgi:hypothetical protein
MPNGRALLDRAQIEIDQLVNRPAMQLAEHLGKSKACGRDADEGRTDSLACEQRHAAAIDAAFLEQALIGRPVRDILPVGTTAPDFSSRLWARQGVKAYRPEVPMPAAKAS